MNANLQVAVERNKDILSAAVRRSDGKTLVVIGEHKKHWKNFEQGKSSDSQVIVPIYEGADEWGNVELTFESLLPEAWYGKLLHPMFLLLLFLGFSSYILFYFYLGKMLKQLDPSQAVPDRVRSALDTMAEGLLVLDAQQNIVLANKAFSILVNESSDKLIGRQISRFPWLDSDDKSLNTQFSPWSKTLSDGIVRTADMIRLTIEQGESKTFMTNCSPVLSGSGKPAGVLISFDDVTELEQKELELRISRDEAEQANRFKSEFLANMSHEIRTPMNAILGFSEVLKRGYDKDSKDSIRYLNTISSSGKHLLNLINDILDLSKVEAGRIEVELIQTSVHHIIHEVIQILQVKANEKNIYLRYEPSGRLPETINTDAGKLRQIVTNLVGNAIKFTDSGGVTIVTRIEENGDDSMLIIEVIDTGIGMSQQQVEDIFNPFTQADSSITRRFGGTGLGLTISKHFSEALGGDIIVESQPGSGSRFITTLRTGSIDGIKLLSVDEILSTQWNEQVTEKKHWKFSASKVLVVDDGEENRELLEVVLSDVGLDIVTAENGQVALDLLASDTFDIVLMDVQMPVMDGYTAVRTIRKRNLTLPVIAMTADAMTGVQQKCLDAGYTEYMTKPVDIDLLIEHLADLLAGELVVASDLVVSQAVEDKSIVEHDNSKTEKIYSSLPMKKEKFRLIVEKFVIRLKDQLCVIDIAWRERDYEELKRLGHWLKGSAGSVGFNQFIEPARGFEQYAMDQDDINLEKSIQTLHSIFSRLEIGAKLEDSRHQTQDSPHQSQDRETDQLLKEYLIPQKVTSRLLDNSPRLRPVIEKFIKQLSERIDLVEDAVLKQNFEEIEKFASWLKGSAGSVGFDAFTEPAKDLLVHAKDKQLDKIKHVLHLINRLNERIIIADVEME